MTTKAREFIDFWVENSVHAVEQYGMPGASQNVNDLARRCIEMAKQQGISEKDMQSEIGDVAQYIRIKLADVNRVEKDRKK